MKNETFGVGIVDTLIGFPTDPEKLYGEMRKSFRDKESREDFAMPAEYMFRDVPERDMDHTLDPIALTLHGRQRCMRVGPRRGVGIERHEAPAPPHPGHRSTLSLVFGNSFARSGM